ncbi:MAG: hypothetical protein ACI9RP_001542, partial [Cyclobacteriaceae bacterium]
MPESLYFLINSYLSFSAIQYSFSQLTLQSHNRLLRQLSLIIFVIDPFSINH